MKLTRFKTIVPGIVVVFLATAIFCCCMQRQAVAANFTSAEHCHQHDSGNAVPAQHSSEECQCAGLGSFVPQKVFTVEQDLSSDFYKIHHSSFTFEFTTKTDARSLLALSRIFSHQAGQSFALIPVYLQHSVLRI